MHTCQYITFCLHTWAASIIFFFSIFWGWVGHTWHILTSGPERRRWQECVQRATPVQLWSMWALPVTSVIFISDGKCSGTHIAPHLHRDTLQVAQLRTYMQVIHSMWCDYSHTCRSYTACGMTTSIHAGHT